MPAPDQYPRWQGIGILWRQNNDDEVTANQIVAPSPAAEAGVQTSDVIMAVNGKDVKSLSDDVIAGLLQNSHRPNVSLTLKQPGVLGPIPVSIVPRELLAAPTSDTAPNRDTAPKSAVSINPISSRRVRDAHVAVRLALPRLRQP